MMDSGLKLKQSMDKFMGQVIDEAYQISTDEFVYKKFRKKVLDLGNQLIREFNEEFTKRSVHYKLTREELLENEHCARRDKDQTERP